VIDSGADGDENGYTISAAIVTLRDISEEELDHIREVLSEEFGAPITIESVIIEGKEFRSE
jgi:F0F1-type ATP synthase delta subunit